MKKLIFTIILSAFLLPGQSQKITKNAARAIAQEFFNTRNAIQADLHLVHTSYSENSPTYYIFNRATTGYIIVSADSRMNLILGYSDSGTFDINNIPSNMQAWLDGYSEQITQFRHNGQFPNYTDTLLSTEVKPLLNDIAWDQGSPYNDMCPYYSGRNRSATGCAATAMAQIMRYYSYPSRGQGTHSYTPTIYPNIGELTVDFSQSTYDWANMPPRYTDSSNEKQKSAVAKLMYDCGVSIDMEYGPESGALSQNWCSALINHFTYDKGITMRTRSFYTLQDWDAVIRHELDNGRPIYVTGFNSMGGHAFVFDGYDKNGFIHINWGWSGMSNGYFRSTELTPTSQGIGGSDGGFNQRLFIITGIQPPQPDSEWTVELYSTEGLYSSQSKTSRTAPVDITLRGKTVNCGWRQAQCDFGLIVTNQSGCPVYTIEGNKDITIACESSVNNITYPSVDLSSLPEGQYTIYPVTRTTGGSHWYRIRDSYVGFPNYLLLTITEEDMEFKSPTGYQIESNTPTISEIYEQLNFNISTTIYNSGDTEYTGEIKAIFYDKNTDIKKAETTGHTITVRGGGSEQLNMMFATPINAGEYNLVLVCDNFMKLHAPISVTVHTKPSSAAILKTVTPLTLTENTLPYNQLSFEATLQCSEGVYSGPVLIYIYDEDGLTVQSCLNPENIFLKAGETTTVTITGSFENGMPGNTYKANLIDGINMTYIYPLDTSSCTFTLSGETGISHTETKCSRKEYYTPSGVLVPSTSTLQPGLYIVKEYYANYTKTYKIIIR